MFDLAATLNSGQAFHWQSIGEGFAGMIGDQPAWLAQRGAELEIDALDASSVRHYLALDHDMDAIRASFPKGDAPLEAAMRYCPGLRILRQPKWECLAAFITSSLKQVAHISAISHTLRRRFGNRHSIRGIELWSYPGPEILASVGEPALRACGLGYRAKFLWQTACMISEGCVDLEAVPSDDRAAADFLQQLPGVGPKIAHCVLLFGYERLGAFPVDVWVERVLKELYFPRKRVFPPSFFRNFIANHFGPNAGYAQQFLFHHARMTKFRHPDPI